MALDPDGRWRKSTRCGADFECVEVSAVPGQVSVRGAAGGPVLTYPATAWRAFCTSVREGRLVAGSADR
jgi:hypothetical protein